MDFLCDVDDIFLFLIDAAGICICFMYISMAFLSRVAGGREICLFKSQFWCLLKKERTKLTTNNFKSEPISNANLFVRKKNAQKRELQLLNMSATRLLENKQTYSSFWISGIRE
ncbi:hypothetical protein Csa_000936 [Cucumis sativus]|nr:hypothetical protein Csa_000936 [Cucumis sativus]